MTNYDVLIDNITKLEDAAYTNEFPIEKFLLDEKEVVKKILKQKNPQLTDEEVDYIVENEDTLIKKEENKTTKEEAKKKKTKKNKEDKKKENEEERKKREAELEAAKEQKRKEIKEKIKVYKDTYKEKLKQLYTEAKALLREIKAAVFRLIKDIKDITKKFVTSTIQTFSSIPAIAIMIAAPPWNIAAAISTTMLIVDVYLELLNRTKNVIPFLDPLRKLSLVTDKKNLSVLSSILNVPVKILLALWAPILAIGDLVKKLIDSILNILKNRRTSVFKKATAKLRSLGHIPHNPESIGVAGIEIKPYGDRREYTVNGIRLHAYSEEDAEEVADLLSTFRVNAPNQSNPSSSNKVIAYNSTLADELQGKLEDLNEQLNQPDLNFPDTTNAGKENQPSGSTTTVFDVELPDGSKLYGISEEQLEDLKLSYNVVLNRLETLEQSISADDEKFAANLLNFQKVKNANTTYKADVEQVFATLNSPVATISDQNSLVSFENLPTSIQNFSTSLTNVTFRP